MFLVAKKRTLTIAFLLSFILFNIGSTLASAHTTSTSSIYIDKKLGFSLQFPTSWVATSQPGRANNSNASVTFTNKALPGTIVQIGVMQKSTAAADFAARGKPTLSIGSYPAFQVDTHAGQQTSVPCLGRIFLAHNDTVIATWCSSDASAHAQQFDTILATYHDATTTSSISSFSNTAIQPLAQNTVNPVLTCGQVMQSPGPLMWGNIPTGDATFGTQWVNPNDPVWTNTFGEGVAVCDDYASSSGAMWEQSYLFQCIELANRFINEEWGLTELNVDAFAYYDYYEGIVSHTGEARAVFGNQVQQTDDASQGNNSALPKPGDLLVFQDVTDGTHWTSGEIPGDPGHVAVVTSATPTQVNVVQENWYNGETWSFPVSKQSNGYHIIDNSGMPGRITRGWIHFSANSSTTGIATTYNGQQWTAKMQPDNHIEISNRQSKYYFTDTTKDTPSIAFLNGKVFVAFLGNDTANQIHIFDGAITSSTSCPSSNPCHFPGYILNNSTQTAPETSGHGPALSSDATHLYLAFTGTEAGNTGHVHIEQTTNGTTSASWTNRADLAGTTNNAPSTTALNGQQWVAYSGTDGRINLATSQSNYTFTDTTNTTPALSFLKGTVFVAFLSSNNSGQIHLFDGAITNSTSCPSNNACHFGGYILDNSSQTTAENASGSPALASTASSLYLAFPGTEPPPAHAHIEDTTSGTTSASWGNRADLGA